MVDRRGERLDVLLIALPELVEEVIAQQRDVLGALAQRRHAQRDRVDAEVEILSQAPLAKRRVEIDVRGADQTKVDVDDPVAPDRPVLALLQHPQQLRLEVRRHLADFVEQQRAALGHLEESLLVHRRAGERAFLVAEQLRLDEVLRNRCAIDLDERTLRPLAVVVNRVRDQLLAGAVLALNEDVGFAGGHAFDQLEELLHLLALADYVLELVAVLQLLLQLLVLVDQRLLLDRFFQFVEQALGVDRLFEEVEGAGLHRLDRPRNIALAGDDNHFGLAIDLLELAHELDAVDIGKDHVGHYGIRAPCLEELFAARPNQSGPDFIAGMFEQNLQPLGHCRLIVYREHALFPFETHNHKV